MIRQESDRADHQETMDWLVEHPDALDDYVDEWVALVGHEVVGHGPTMTAALHMARECGHDDPLLVPVMPADELLIV